MDAAVGAEMAAAAREDVAVVIAMSPGRTAIRAGGYMLTCSGKVLENAANGVVKVLSKATNLSSVGKQSGMC